MWIGLDSSGSGQDAVMDSHEYSSENGREFFG